MRTIDTPTWRSPWEPSSVDQEAAQRAVRNSAARRQRQAADALVRATQAERLATEALARVTEQQLRLTPQNSGSGSPVER